MIVFDGYDNDLQIEKDFVKEDKQRHQGSVSKMNGFHWNLWLFFVISNLCFGFGGNLLEWKEKQDVELAGEISSNSDKLPNTSDIFMLIHTIVSAVFISKLCKKSHRPIVSSILYICICACVMGSMMILVGNIFRRELHCFECSDLFTQNIHNRNQMLPQSLLCKYDIFGRILRFTPYFLLLLLYTLTSQSDNNETKMCTTNIVFCYYVIFAGFYYWHQVTQEQIYLEFCISYLFMFIVWKRKRKQGWLPDINSIFVFYAFNFTFYCLVVYCGWLIYRGINLQLYIYLLFKDYRRLNCNK